MASRSIAEFRDYGARNAYDIFPSEIGNVWTVLVDGSEWRAILPGVESHWAKVAPAATSAAGVREEDRRAYSTRRPPVPGRWLREPLWHRPARSLVSLVSLNR